MRLHFLYIVSEFELWATVCQVHCISSQLADFIVLCLLYANNFPKNEKMSLNKCRQWDEKSDTHCAGAHIEQYRCRRTSQVEEDEGEKFVHFLSKTTTYGHLTNIKHFNGFRCNVVDFIYVFIACNSQLHTFEPASHPLVQCTICLKTRT